MTRQSVTQLKTGSLSDLGTQEARGMKHHAELRKIARRWIRALDPNAAPQTQARRGKPRNRQCPNRLAIHRSNSEYSTIDNRFFGEIDCQSVLYIAGHDFQRCNCQELGASIDKTRN